MLKGSYSFHMHVRKKKTSNVTSSMLIRNMERIPSALPLPPSRSLNVANRRRIVTAVDGRGLAAIKIDPPFSPATHRSGSQVALTRRSFSGMGALVVVVVVSCYLRSVVKEGGGVVAATHTQVKRWWCCKYGAVFGIE